MKRFVLIIIALFWILSLAVLIISLTDLYPENILKENRLIIGIGFITVTRLLKPIYNLVIKEK